MNHPRPQIPFHHFELATCIKVPSKFNANDGHPSIDSPEFDRIRPLIYNLYHMGQTIKTQSKGKPFVEKID